MNNYLETILRQMCSMVGADYNSIDFKKDLWFHEYSWTEEQEKAYIGWLSEELYNNKELREYLMRQSRKTHKDCLKTAQEFVWNYGWKVQQSL